MEDLIERLRTSLSDRYTIQHEIGSGGMATVYLAEDVKHHRQVALKLLKPELGAVLGGERFLREIHIAAGLNHPHILGLHDSGEIDGLLYYVMPFVAGESLRQRLERQTQLSIDEAIETTRQVASALDYAHRQGVVHRDIKPENILLQEGQAVVADFGIARALRVAGGERLTETGLSLGTPHYMSPEQASGAQDLDSRSDVYALACVMYEMLAGEPPFTGPTAPAIIARQLVDPVPSLRTVRPTVPEELERAIEKALAKVPADRYDTAGAFVEAAGEAAQVEVVPTRERRTPRRRVGRRALGGVVALVLLGAGIFLAQWFVGGSGPAGDADPNTVAVLPLVPAAGDDAALGNLGHAVAAQISANLEGIGDIQTVTYQTIRANETEAGGSLEDAAHWARSETGAGRVAQGSLVRSGEAVTFEVKLLSTSDLASVAHASFTSAADDPRLLADSISWQLLEQLWTAGEAPVPWYDHLIGRPFPAVRDYLLGERLLTSFYDVTKAARAFERAFHADTTLLVASVWYSYVIDTYGSGPEMPEVDSVVKQAHLRHVEDLTPQYRDFVEARALRWKARIERYEEILAEPGRQFWPVAFRYADDLWHWASWYGYSAVDLIQAFLDCVDANPQHMECWAHLLWASVGKDAAAFRRTYEYFEANLAQIDSTMWGPGSYSAKTHQFVRLFMAYEEGDPPAALLDSVTRNLEWLRIATTRIRFAEKFIWIAGAPRMLHDLRRRQQELGIDVEIPPSYPYWEAYAWAMRGAWDSVLVSLDRYTRESSDDRAPLLAFKLTAVGEWLAALPEGTSDEYLPGTVAYIEGIENPAERAYELATLHYTRGIMGALWQDTAALGRARQALGGIDDSLARQAERALAGYALQLRGSVAEAVDSLDPAISPDGSMVLWPFKLAIHHMSASRWLLAAGDTVRAARFLSSCQWTAVDQEDWEEYALLAGHCYLALARVEDARGRDGLAREYYRQFLKRYDMPVEAHRQMVEEAREAYERVTGG